MLRFVYMMHEVYLLLGANLDERLCQLDAARQQIKWHIGNISIQSAIYETSSWGVEESQPDYLNQVIQVSTALKPMDLLEEIHKIEYALGRVRDQKWGSRVIDIDILFYESEIINEPDLIIPHPYFQERNFAMAPMYEIASCFCHPVLKKTVSELYAESADPLGIWLYKEADSVSMVDYLGEDLTIQKTMLELFMKQTPDDLQLLVNYIASANYQDAAAQAHRMKPTLNYVGAINLRVELESLEQDLIESVAVEKKIAEIQLRFELLFTELSTYLDSLKCA